MEQNIKLMEEIISKSMGNEKCVEVQPQSRLHMRFVFLFGLKVSVACHILQCVIKTHKSSKLFFFCS